MSARELARFTELHFGHFNKYEFYVSASPPEKAGIDMDDWEIIPEFSVFAKIQKLQEAIQQTTAAEVRFKIDTHCGQTYYTLNNDFVQRVLCSHINGTNNMEQLTEIMKQFVPGAPPERVRELTLKRLEKLIFGNMILFRHPEGNVSNLNRYNF